MTQLKRAWEEVATRIETYLADSSVFPERPPIENYLPDRADPARHLAVVELCKLEMAQLQIEKPLQFVERYLQQYPELQECTGGVPLDLLLEEIRLGANGAKPDVSEYTRRFPVHRAAIEQFVVALQPQSNAKVPSMVDIQKLFVAGQSFEDFDIHRMLGCGGFACVFLAKQTSMHRMVALKISADRGDEAKTLAQLDHPNVVRVHDVRLLGDRGMRLLSMQYVPGGTLADVIRIARNYAYDRLNGSLVLEAIDQALLTAGMPAPEDSNKRRQLAAMSWPEVVAHIGLQVAEALEYAHHHKVLHRDVKPANVLLTAEGVCKLADFNISYSGDLIGSNPSSYFGGSLMYMSPEQLSVASWTQGVKASELDNRSDIFSLGCILWELLTLDRPWPNDEMRLDWGETIDALCRRRQQELPRITQRYTPSPMGERLMQCVRAALLPIRDERIASASAFASQMRLCLSPRAWNILHAEHASWSRFACRWPNVVALIAIFVPNGLAGMFNYQYNHAWLTNRHTDAHDHLVFVSIILNFVSFGMGGVFYLFVVGPITREVALRNRTLMKDPSRRIERTFMVGHTAAIFGLSLWLIAGLIFPWMLSMRLPAFDYRDALHFFLSLAVCGAIAVSYPFLGMSLIAIESWYGLLIGADIRDEQFRDRCAKLLGWCDRYLLMATSVPLAGLAMLLVAQDAPVRPALIFLVAASALGLFLAFRVHHRLHSTIDTLTPVIDPQNSE